MTTPLASFAIYLSLIAVVHAELGLILIESFEFMEGYPWKLNEPQLLFQAHYFFTFVSTFYISSLALTVERFLSDDRVRWPLISLKVISFVTFTIGHASIYFVQKEIIETDPYDLGIHEQCGYYGAGIFYLKTIFPLFKGRSRKWSTLEDMISIHFYILLVAIFVSGKSAHIDLISYKNEYHFFHPGVGDLNKHVYLGIAYGVLHLLAVLESHEAKQHKDLIIYKEYRNNFDSLCEELAPHPRKANTQL